MGSGSVGFSLRGFRPDCAKPRRLMSLCANHNFKASVAKQAAEKVAFSVIPSEARNPSGDQSQKNEGFLGIKRASE